MWKYLFSRPQALKSKYEFKMEFSFDKRRIEGERIRTKYPDKVPIILEKSDSSDIPEIEKKKLLVLESLTVGQLINIIRKQINLHSYQAMYLFVDNTVIPSLSESLGDIYKKHANKDNFLYITYAVENTFG